jgi:NAD(P)-dependent dehydrogenase (short-subunit alcohol dehydrogenase family)
MTHHRDSELAGRHFVVTGAGRGIGAAIARELARSGAAVSLVGRDRERLEATRRGISQECGGTHGVFLADVTDAGAVARAFARIGQEAGAVYGLVNNAGAAASGSFLDTDDETWRRMLDTNLMGAVFCTRAVLPGMIERGAGRIVNVASTASLAGYRFVAAYVAAKHALLGMTRALALEVARDGVTVNAVCPGYTQTDLLAESVQRAVARTGKSEEDIRRHFASANPQGRILDPAEIARAVAWLCAPGQAGVTGQSLVVDGGALL